MGTKDWTDTALVECLSDNLPLSGEQRSILITLVVERSKQDKDADRWRTLRDTPATAVAPGPLRGWLFARPGGGESMDRMVDELLTPNV